MLYSQRTDDGGRTYAERTKWPKYNGTQNVYTLGYNDAGNLLRRRLSDWTKDEHLKEARDLMAERRSLQRKYERKVGYALESLGEDPGPLISGIVSDKFSAHTKNELRALARHIGQLGGAAAAHFAAAGKRLETFRNEWAS